MGARAAAVAVAAVAVEVAAVVRVEVEVEQVGMMEVEVEVEVGQVGQVEAIQMQSCTTNPIGSLCVSLWEIAKHFASLKVVSSLISPKRAETIPLMSRIQEDALESMQENQNPIFAVSLPFGVPLTMATSFH